MTLIFDIHDIIFENIGKDIINIGQKCKESGASKVLTYSVLVKNNINVTKFIMNLN